MRAINRDVSMNENASHEKPVQCERCGGNGYTGITNGITDDCEECDGEGWLGVNPELPIPIPAGSDRIPYYQVRYASGVFLFSQQDFVE